MMMQTYPDSFAAVQIHVNDDFETSWAADRGAFYYVGGTPTAWFDGLIELIGAWTEVVDQFAWYESEFLARRAVPTDVTIDVTGDQVVGQTYQVQAEVCVEAGGTGKTMRVNMAQVLDRWPSTNSYSRNGFKQAAETRDITVAPGTCQSVQSCFTLDADSWANQDDVSIVVWAQEPRGAAPADVYQAAVMSWPFPTLDLPGCCIPEGGCISTPHDDCVALGGDPLGPGSFCCDGGCNPLKWSQPPLINPASPNPDCFWGWDEVSTYDCAVPGCRIVADDWACTDRRPVTDIHWWGSYPEWVSEEPPALSDPGAPDYFHIGLWTDIPAGVDAPHSHPGEMFVEWIVPRSDLNERSVGCDFHPDFPGPDTCFRYDFAIPQEEWFVQESDGMTIYWISISAHHSTGEPTIPWGWKTREHFFNDAAVTISNPNNPTVPGSEYVSGAPIEHPEGIPWDMAFTVSTYCPEVEAPELPTGGAGYDKTRYVSIIPGGAGTQTAIRVTLRSMPAPFQGLSGQEMWVGPPRPICENAGQSTVPEPGNPPAYGCGSSGNAALAFQSAGLQCTPHCADFGSVGLLHFTDDEIIPGAVYDVQIINCFCDGDNEANYSEPLTIDTTRWGDLVKDCSTYPCGPADGLTGIVDVTAVLDKFKNLPNCVTKTRADIEPSLPDLLINITDVTYCLGAFLGETYPPSSWPDPGGCP